jgi:hypothetical protein
LSPAPQAEPQAEGFSSGLSPAPQAAGFSSGLSLAPQATGLSLAPQEEPLCQSECEYAIVEYLLIFSRRISSCYNYCRLQHFNLQVRTNLLVSYLFITIDIYNVQGYNKM